MIRYEDLAAHPVDVMRSLMSTSGLGETDRVLEFARVSTDSRRRDAPAQFGALADAVQVAREAFDV